MPTTTTTPATTVPAPASREVAPRAWVAEVCGSLDDWQDDLQRLAGDVQADLGEQSSPEQAKRALVEFFGRGATATDVLTARVAAAGTPAVEAGRQLATDFLAPLGAVRQVFVDAQDRVRRLPGDDAAAFQEQAVEAGTAVQEGTVALSEELRLVGERFPAPLRTAVQGEPACAALAMSP